MNPYFQFVSEYSRLARDGSTYPLGVFAPFPRPHLAPDAPKVMIFSPHPDDEVIIGGLALRLMRESNWNVINVAVTQGSRPERRAERLKELKHCCECIGFDLEQPVPGGLEKVNPKARLQEPEHWAKSVKSVADILDRHRPLAILFPHDRDWNSTHVGTHFLVMDAIRSLPSSFNCFTVETEFWGQNASPNLMVELSVQHVADLITALSFHVGEVQRNPYHLTLPAWMIDNVRRGAELVGGQGGPAPDFAFATLYRLRRWAGGRLGNVCEAGRCVGCADLPDAFFC